MNNKITPIFVGLGLLCLTLGGTTLYIEQSSDIATNSLIALGVILLLTTRLITFRNDQRRNNKQGQQTAIKASWKKPVLLASIVVLCTIATVAINYLAYSLPYRWDVTQAKQHTLTQSTVDYMANLKRDVQLTALYVGLPPKYLVDQLDEYKRTSKGRITAEIIDPIEQIGYAAQFGNVISGKQKKLIVKSGEERRDIDFTKASLTEEQITNAIVRVTREKRVVYFLTGHGEYAIENEDDQGLSHFSTLLNANNVISKTLMLGTNNRIPEDCDVLIIAGPQSELTPHEDALINTYLKKGGDALFLVEQVIVSKQDTPLTEQQIRSNPSLNSILNQWGINVESDTVVDLSNHIQSDVGSPATKNYLPHKAITVGLDYTFYVHPRSISTLADHRPSIKMVPIVLTESKDNSWAETDRSFKIHFDKGVDKPGPIPISYVVLEKKELEERSDTRIIIFTDADFLSNAYIKQYSNAAMGLNIVNWLSELDYRVIVGQEEIHVERLDLTSKQRRMVAAILFLIPFFIALAGIGVWLKRR